VATNERAAGRARAVTWGDAPFLVASLISGGLLLYLGRSLTFWFDEWRVITFDGNALDYFRPLNEHWSTIPLALYRATFDVVELHSYLPYLAQVIALHLVACAGAYVLMRRRLGRLAATILALPLLLLGTGAENLYWAFQTGFVGSVASGLWALVLVELRGRRAAVASAALLVVSLMCSGIGLFFVAALAVRSLAEGDLRTRAVVALPAALTYAGWYAAFGRAGIDDTAELGDARSVARFVFRGVGFAAEAVVGLDPLPTGRVVGVLLVVALAALAVRRVLRGRTPGLALGCLAGLVAMYAVIGVARAELEPDYTTRGRYVYVAAFFLALCVADLVPRDPLSGVPRSPRSLLIGVAAVVAFAWVVAVNVNALQTERTQFQFQADVTRAVVDLAVEHEGEPWLDPEAHLDLMPPARELPRLVREHGSPLEDAYFAVHVPKPSARAYRDARAYLTTRGQP
jgi:hypothetical protein